jgi:hypothetical protein
MLLFTWAGKEQLHVAVLCKRFPDPPSAFHLLFRRELGAGNSRFPNPLRTKCSY